MQKHIIRCWKRDFDKILLSKWKTTAWYESIDGPARQPTGNLPIPDGLGLWHWTEHELMVLVSGQYGQPIGQKFDLDPDLDPKW